MSADDMTPMRQQYLAIKAQYPEKIVLFRLGDFYEAFDQDAEIVARELDIVLTGRGGRTKDERIPMAGVPHHAVDNYVARLVDKGYHVVIAEQMEPPGKKLVRREVTRVITPGTVYEPAMLDQSRNNYLLAIVPEAERLEATAGESSNGSAPGAHRPAGRGWSRAGLAYVDITTGEFAATQLGDEQHEATLAVLEELSRLQPREVLLPATWAERGVTLPDGAHLTSVPEARFAFSGARQALLEHFQTTTLDGFGLGDKPLAVRAAGAVLLYLRETQRGSLPQLTSLRAYSTANFMMLDASTRRSLEITESIRAGRRRGSLLGVLDRTVTPMGGRLLVAWLNQPLLEIDRLNARLNAVASLYDEGRRRAEMIAALRAIADLERLTNRVLAGNVGPRGLLALRSSLENVPTLRQTIAGVAALASAHDRLDPCHEIVELIERAIADEPPPVLNDRVGIIRPGFSAELDELNEHIRHAREWIAGLEATERERTGIKSLKVGFNKVFGYYIEVSHANTIRVPDDYIRKQTLTNAERYITPDLKEYESLVLNAEERILEIEARLFREVCAQIAQKADRLLRTARAVAHLDVFGTLAEVAAREGYCRPQLTTDNVLIIREGRHPVVEQLLVGERYVPNDCLFDGAQRVHIITGPNMSGKSTAIRQVAIIVLMAQVGSFVPAAEAQIGLVDRIFTRIGAQDEIHAGQSTFMVEMTETAALLSAATERSLLILDEIGRGTSTYDGLAIARAVIEFIHNSPRLNARTLFATHYHELTELARLLPRVRNYNVAVLEEGEQIVFLHRVEPGSADRSYGIHVAQIAGIPRPVVKRAREILRDLEAQASDFGAPFADVTPAVEEGAAPDAQALPAASHPALEALRYLKIEELSPLDAITRLYELQRLARSGP